MTRARFNVWSSVAALFAAGFAWSGEAGAILAANHAACGGSGWDGKAAIEVRFAFAGQGMTGTTESTYDVRTGRFIDSSSIGPTRTASGFDGREAWLRDMSGAVTPQAGGDARELAINEAYRNANLWWRSDRGGATIVLLGSRGDEGRTYEVLSVKPHGGKAFEAWFDAQSHLLARTVEPQGPQTITAYIGSYRRIDGVLLAGKLVIDDGTGVQYRQTITLLSARFVPARPQQAYSAPRSQLTDARILNAAGRTVVPFELLNNHIYAEVKVNGKGPFRFIFDTGGHDLLTPDTAKALGVKSEGQAAGTGAGEDVVNTSFASGVSFQIGDLLIEKQTIAVLPFEAPQVEGFAQQGMIGFEVLRRFVTQIDYGRKTLTFIDPAAFDPAGSGTPVAFVFYSHLPQVAGSFEGIPGQFDIDTGSRVELTLTKPFVDANDLIRKNPRAVIAVDGWGVGGPSRSYITRANELTLGPVRIGNLVAGFATQSKGAFADPNYAGNVGSGLLKRFVVTFDYARQMMYLRPLPAPVADSGTFDRAGLWINTGAAGLKVTDVTAAGPAAKAGVQVGDAVTAVDGVAASSISLSDLRARLRDGEPGTVVAFTIERGGATRVVHVTLEDQI
jgi:hypothetical protein